jgi:transketolase
MGDLPDQWDADLPSFPADGKGMATRAASGMVIYAIAGHLPELIGGSADLTPSNDTWIKDIPDFQKNTPEGRNFHFGVREHGMGTIINGMAVRWCNPYGVL